MVGAPPDDLDLLAFFEAEPSLLDFDVPWTHNTATYKAERDGFAVVFQISPSYSALKASVSFDGRDVVEAEVSQFKSLELVNDGGRETLIARFGASTASALYLTIKHRIQLAVVASSDS
jgi:hypothetical protein